MGISISGDLVLPTCIQIDDGTVRPLGFGPFRMPVPLREKRPRPAGHASGRFRRQGRAATRPDWRRVQRRTYS